MSVILPWGNNAVSMSVSVVANEKKGQCPTADENHSRIEPEVRTAYSKAKAKRVVLRIELAGSASWWYTVFE